MKLLEDNTPVAEDSDDFTIIKVKMMEDFITEATKHSVQCGVALKLIKHDTHLSARAIELWKCLVWETLLKFQILTGT